MKIKFFFEIIKASFYSKEFYQDICYKWKKTGISFLLATTIIFSIPSVVYSLYELSIIDANKIAEYLSQEPTENNNPNDINYLIYKLISQLPEVILENGIVICQECEKEKFSLAINQDLELIIDTSSNFNIPESTKNLIFLDPHNITVIYKDKNTKIYKIADVLSTSEKIVVNQDTILNLLYSINFASISLFSLIHLLLLSISTAFHCIIKALIYSLFAFFMVKLYLQKTMSLLQMFRVAIFSSIPCAIIILLLGLLFSQNQILLSLANYISLFSSLGFSYFAFKSCFEEKNTIIYKKN